MTGRPVARRLGWERNELRRTTDRIESLMVFVLVFTFLAGAPLLARWAGGSSYRADRQAQQWEREHVHRIDAVLVEDAGRTTPDGTRAVAAPIGRVSWTAPDGSTRTGTVQLAAEARAGSRVTVWVDDFGELRSPPARHNPVSQAVMAGAAVVLCLAAGLAGLHRIGRGLLDRRRDRAWQREWLEVGPRWSGDRR